MNCPVCNVALSLSERQGIEIDYCPKCRGVWLDRGELDKLIEKNADQRNYDMNGSRDSKHYSDDDYKHQQDYNKHGKYRKKSLLKDLFDF
ncbi:MAG: zf-TFIIB domain-containing protein [Bacteroidota bacterium]